MKNNINKIGIIGAGGWGTALSVMLAGKGCEVLLWAYESDVVDEINNRHTNSQFLPGINLPEAIKATGNPSDFSGIEIIVMAVPTQFIRSLLNSYNFDLSGKLIVNVAKGIEKSSLLRVSEIFSQAADISPERYVILTGPSHAEEVARHTPTTVVAASEEHDSAKLIQDIFSEPNFRVYSTDDVVGCEIGSSLKNVIAIAAGVIDGLEMGDNTKAALITRGLAEMSRLGISLGANPLTFSGLSGLGDLIVTCNSRHSRNRFVGEQIGKGKTLKEVLAGMKMVAEGVETTDSAYLLSKKQNVEMPIVEQMHRILFEDLNPLTAINELMTRSYRREWWH